MNVQTVLILFLCTIKVLSAASPALPHSSEEKKHNCPYVQPFKRSSYHHSPKRLPKTKQAHFRKSLKKPLNKDPFNFGRHDNIIWKFAGGIFITGIAVAFICAIAILKIGRGTLAFWLWGFLIGLALIVISLPFMAIGAIID